MPHLPNQVPFFLGQALRAKFDCSEQPLPPEIEILLCRLDGAERRQQVQTRLSVSRQEQRLDRPADVHWLPADQVREAGPEWDGKQRHFESLRKAVQFVMQELTIADRANVWINNEDGSLTIEQIERLQC